MHIKIKYLQRLTVAIRLYELRAIICYLLLFFALFFIVIATSRYRMSFKNNFCFSKKFKMNDESLKKISLMVQSLCFVFSSRWK